MASRARRSRSHAAAWLPSSARLVSRGWWLWGSRARESKARMRYDIISDTHGYLSKEVARRASGRRYHSPRGTQKPAMTSDA
jgi:hypothetical protein